jgi:hypothetical protein
MGRKFFTLAGGLFALFGTCVGAAAQGPMPPGSIPGGQQQLCLRLESQLATIDRGPNDPVRAAQIQRYDEAIRRQQADLDRILARSRRLGCESKGFFSLFSNQPAECEPLTRQIQQLHGAIDRLMSQQQRAQGSTTDREAQRRSVLIALSQNDCGPQYRSAAEASRPRGIFESLFAPGANTPPGTGPSDLPLSGTYRTLCVRTCDGYYWPISFSTVPGRFADDERVCQRMCPAAPVTLFTHRNPGEEVAQAVSLNGQAYSDMPNAFLYRKQYNAACSCRRTGETWAHALQNLNDTGERGDIVVTEERAKQLSKPRGGRDAKSPSRGKPQESTPALRGSSTAGNQNTPVRRVGPTFLPKQQ